MERDGGLRNDEDTKIFPTTKPQNKYEAGVLQKYYTRETPALSLNKQLQASILCDDLLTESEMERMVWTLKSFRQQTHKIR